MMGFLGIKTAREREMDRRIQHRKLVRGLKSQVSKLDQLRSTFVDHVREATTIGDEQAKRRYALACAATDARKQRIQKQLLAVEGMRSIQEMVRINNEFADFAIEMGRAMQGYMSPAKLAKMEEQLERGVMHAEEIDEIMATVLDSVSDSVLTFGQDVAESDADSIAETILAESAKTDDSHELEEQVARELALVREEMERKGDNGK